MNPHLLPAQLPEDMPAWTQTVMAFLVEKERRSGSHRTVEGYARMLWPFLMRVGSPDRVTPAHVLAWAHGIGASGRDRALLLTFVLTGRRRAEVIGLTAGDISLEGETAYYSYRAKGGKRGRRELPRPAYEALCATLSDAGVALATMDPSASLWQAAAGTRGVTGSTFYARFRRYLRAAGLAPTGLHVLRHTAAKLRRDAGASIEAVSSFLDHSS